MMLKGKGRIRKGAAVHLAGDDLPRMGKVVSLPTRKTALVQWPGKSRLFVHNRIHLEVVDRRRPHPGWQKVAW